MDGGFRASVATTYSRVLIGSFGLFPKLFIGGSYHSRRIHFLVLIHSSLLHILSCSHSTLLILLTVIRVVVVAQDSNINDYFLIKALSRCGKVQHQLFSNVREPLEITSKSYLASARSSNRMFLSCRWPNLVA